LRHTLPLLLLTLFVAGAAQARDIRYVSDKQYIPLRSGAGNEYRIVHRGIPSGTKLEVARVSGDGVWASAAQLLKSTATGSVQRTIFTSGDIAIS